MSHCPDHERLKHLLDHRLEDTELDEIEQHIEERRLLLASTLDDLDGVPRFAISRLGRVNLITSHRGWSPSNGRTLPPQRME